MTLDWPVLTKRAKGVSMTLCRTNMSLWQVDDGRVVLFNFIMICLESVVCTQKGQPTTRDLSLPMQPRRGVAFALAARDQKE